MLKSSARWNTISLAVEFKNPLFFALTFFSLSAFADYGWIPNYQNLNLKAGFDYFVTSENFTSDGDRANITYKNEAVQLTRYLFWVEPEYGLAKDWSALLRLGFIAQSLDSKVGTPGAIL